MKKAFVLGGIAAVASLAFGATLPLHSQELDEFVYSTTGGFTTIHDTLIVKGNGLVVLDRRDDSPAGLNVHRTGYTTAAELQSLDDALHDAPFFCIPPVLDDPHPVTGAATVTMTRTMQGTTQTRTVVKEGFYGPYVAPYWVQPDMVVVAVRALAERLVTDAEGEELTGMVGRTGTAWTVGGRVVAPGSLSSVLASHVGRWLTVRARTSVMPARLLSVVAEMNQAGPVRAQASAAGAVVARLHKGDRVLVRGVSGHFDAVHVNGHAAFVAAQWLTFSLTADPQPIVFPVPPGATIAPPAPPTPAPAGYTGPTLCGNVLASASSGVTYVVDTTGSMQWDDEPYTTPSGVAATGTKLVRAVAEVEKSIDSLPDTWTFNVVGFDCNAHPWSAAAMPATAANKAAAIAWLHTLQPAGMGSATGPVVATALGDKSCGLVVLVTDGDASCGLGTGASTYDDFKLHREAILAANTQHAIVDCLAVGAGTYTSQFLQDTASQNGGYYVSLP